MARMKKPTFHASALFLASLLALACSSSSSVTTPDGSHSPTDGASALDTPVAADAGTPADGGARDATPDFGPAPRGAGPVVYVGGFRPEIDVFRLDMTTLKLTQVAVVADPPASPS